MATSGEIRALKKRLTTVCFICAVVVPLLNNFVLSLILSEVSGDIMHRTSAAILGYFIPSLDTVNLFLLYASLVNGMVRFGIKNSKLPIALCLIRIVIVYAAYLTIGAIVVADFKSVFTSNLFYCLTNAAIDTLLLTGVIVLTAFLRSKYVDENNTDITVRRFFDPKNPLLVITGWTTALICAFLLSGCLINTFTDTMTYGANDLNASEIIYLVTPYVKWLVKTAAGYTIMWCFAKWIDTQWKTITRKERT